MHTSMRLSSRLCINSIPLLSWSSWKLCSTLACACLLLRAPIERDGDLSSPEREGLLEQDWTYTNNLTYFSIKLGFWKTRRASSDLKNHPLNIRIDIIYVLFWTQWLRRGGWQRELASGDRWDMSKISTAIAGRARKNKEGERQQKNCEWTMEMGKEEGCEEGENDELL